MSLNNCVINERTMPRDKITYSLELRLCNSCNYYSILYYPEILKLLNHPRYVDVK